jgi:DNA helicase II / ATP-dependent DNA helicase PcrA
MTFARFKVPVMAATASRHVRDIDTPAPTAEQKAIVDFVHQNRDTNIMINAYAGTGKSTTLEMVEAVLHHKPTLYLVFNKDAAKKAEKRFPSSTSVRTLNSLGHRVWMKTVSGVTINGKKSWDIIKEVGSDLRGEDRECFAEVVQGVGLAKSLGYVPKGPQATGLLARSEFHDSLEDRPSPLVAELIDSVLLESIKLAFKGGIDFNDQIYMPTLFGGSFPRFPSVLVDEAQDLNPLNHEMLYKVGKNWVGAVGDPFQSIYGFRGAVRQGMEVIRSHYSMHPSTISQSFRCPEAIVKAARWRVPDYKAMKPGGHYEILSKLNPSEIPDGAAILCRNNAPLLRTAFRLLASERSVQVVGSDIGPKIIKIMSKLGHEDISREALLDEIQEWRLAKLAVTNVPGYVEDTAACMQVFANYGKTLGQAVAYADFIFKSQGTIKLLTGHKAKGLEWPVVYHLEPSLISDHEQDLNLRYVIQTRASEAFYEIAMEDIEWPSLTHA